MKFRERILDAFLSTYRKPVLNDSAESSASCAENIPRKIGDSIHALKKAAIFNEVGVDYNALKISRQYQEIRQNVTVCLRRFDLSNLKTWEEKLAFWINLYNLLTIDAVIQFDVKTSVTEGWLGVMRFFRLAAYNINGNRYSLEDIEHGILRANNGSIYFPGRHFSHNDPRSRYVIADLDPRIHFALNCASQSCPPVAFYEPEKIDKQLDQAAANFINAETVMDVSGVMLRVSRIFKWYEKDFGEKRGVLETLLHYLPENDPRTILLENFGYKAMITYSKYDWELNAL